MYRDLGAGDWFIEIDETDGAHLWSKLKGIVRDPAKAKDKVKAIMATVEDLRGIIPRLDLALERSPNDALLKEAVRAADAAEYAYKRGAVGVTDLLDARRTLYATRLDAASAEADYAKARAAWRAATGIDVTAR
jgi:hypothetical protein